MKGFSMIPGGLGAFPAHGCHNLIAAAISKREGSR